MKKPSEDESEISEAGVRHRPTDEKFVPYLGKPTDGSWRDGHLDKDGEYEQNHGSQALGEVHNFPSS